MHLYLSVTWCMLSLPEEQETIFKSVSEVMTNDTHSCLGFAVTFSFSLQESCLALTKQLIKLLKVVVYLYHSSTEIPFSIQQMAYYYTVPPFVFYACDQK